MDLRTNGASAAQERLRVRAAVAAHFEPPTEPSPWGNIEITLTLMAGWRVDVARVVPWTIGCGDAVVPEARDLTADVYEAIERAGIPTIRR